MQPEHRVLKLWVRPVESAAVEERQSLELIRGKGVDGDHTFGRLRHVTIIFEDDWNAAAAELGREVDPGGRRANVLLSGGNGKRYLGKKLRLGPTLLEVKGVTEPCPQMDQAGEGMMEALKPNARGGIWVRVLEQGRIRVDDTLEAV